MKTAGNLKIKFKYVPVGYTRGLNGLWPHTLCSYYSFQESPYFTHVQTFFYKTIYFSPENGQVEKLRFHTHKMVFGLKCMKTLELCELVNYKVV